MLAGYAGQTVGDGLQHLHGGHMAIDKNAVAVMA